MSILVNRLLIRLFQSRELLLELNCDGNKNSPEKLSGLFNIIFSVFDPT